MGVTNLECIASNVEGAKTKAPPKNNIYIRFLIPYFEHTWNQPNVSSAKWRRIQVEKGAFSENCEDKFLAKVGLNLTNH